MRIICTNNILNKIIDALNYYAASNQNSALLSPNRSKHVRLLSFILAIASFSPISFAQVETIAPGSFIINMGVTPQTINNGLRPYGMIYDLVKNHLVPIKWVINPAKSANGIDFSHNSIDYKGGTFIIPAAFRTAAVNARITYWQSQGVVGATTVAPISVPVYVTIKAVPTWTLDDQNGAIAQGYLNNALIPASAYNWLAPSALSCCNDIFVMPHADPNWPTHGNLYDWNLTCHGAIWLACHAGSALHDLFNPANPSQQMNFLANKTGVASGSGPYFENSLVLWGNHDDGTPPYSYAYPTDPIMQFMGTIDGATQNGSEQIFLPKSSWRAGAKIYTWDPTHSDVPSLSPGPAALMVAGHAFDDPERGLVMLEAAHSHNKSTGPDNIAAQRAFFNFSIVNAIEKAVIPDLSQVPDTMYSGVGTPLTFTLPPGKLISNYTITWGSSCGGSFSTPTNQNTNFFPPTTSFPTACFISVTIIDACGRTFRDVKSVIVGCRMNVTKTITNPSCTPGSTNGSINMTITNGSGTYTWNWSRVSPSGTGSGSGTIINGLSVGTYNVTITDNSGCSKTFQSIVSPSPVINASRVVQDALCNGESSGAINVSVSGGSPAFSFNWGGGITSQNRNNIPAGNYSLTITDTKSCTAVLNSTVNQPALMSLSLTPTHVLCNGQNTGAIDLSVSGGTGSKTYLWSNGASTQNISNLIAGNYTVTVTDANNCKKTANVEITQPANAIGLSSVNTNVDCKSGSTGAIDLTVTGGTADFAYLWSNGAMVEDLSGISAGVYTVTVTDANNCNATLQINITEPSALNLSTSITKATCTTTSDGAINITVTGGVMPYVYDWADLPGTSNIEDRTALLSGNYTITITDQNGCTYNSNITVGATQTTPSPPIGINH